MLIASGTILVLVTWIVAALALMSLGLLPALVTLSPERWRSASTAQALRIALWWGLLVATVFAYLANVWFPLQSGQTARVGLLLLLVMGVPGWWLLARRGWRPGARRPGRSLMVLWLTLALAVIYLAAAALGPVTNYDSGLYHLGAVKYAADYSTIPGLANVFFALGYGTAEFPLAALVGNGPWQGEGYRLLNGMLLSLALIDLWLRSRQTRLTPGFFVLLAGILASFVPMVALSDYWVTSPTQDSAVFILTVVASAYLADAVRGGRGWVASGVVTGVLGIQLVLLRTTMIAFAATGVIVVLGLVIRRRPSNERLLGAGIAFAFFGVIAVVGATVRDVLLSGWLQYPLSLHAFDVPWRATDPAADRIATLGFHRNPADLWASTEGWAWVLPWLEDRILQWETYELLGLLGVAGVLLLVAHRASGRGLNGKVIALATVPSITASAVWWAFTPPSYRFAWGPLITLATVPIGWALWNLATGSGGASPARPRWLTVAVVATAVPIGLVTGYSAVARFDSGSITAARTWQLGVTIPYAVAPVIDAPVQDVMTDSGLRLLQPTDSDQCWDNYPLCTPWPNSSLRLRGDDLADGLLP